MKKSVLGSLLLAIIHSILFYGKELGISVILFAIPSLILLVSLFKKHSLIKNKNVLYLCIPILLLSSTYFLFNNEFFNQVNLIIIPFLYASMIIWVMEDMVYIRKWFGKTISLIVGSLEFIPSSINLIKQAFKVHKKEDSKYTKLKLVILRSTLFNSNFICYIRFVNFSRWHICRHIW